MGRVSMPQGKGSQLHNRREYEKIGRPIPDNIDVSSPRRTSLWSIRIYGKPMEKSSVKLWRSTTANRNELTERLRAIMTTSISPRTAKSCSMRMWFNGGRKRTSRTTRRGESQRSPREVCRGLRGTKPNLKLIGAYIHMDEASPHLHLDYVPVAHGYSRA